jgi:hypothetical protein
MEQEEVMPSFELYERGSAPIRTAMTLSVLAKGTFSLSQAAFAAMGRPEAVQLLYARDENLIGMRPVDVDARSAYAVRVHLGNINVSAMGFCQQYGIDLSHSRRYRAEFLDGMLVVDLRQEPEPIVKAAPKADGQAVEAR